MKPTSRAEDTITADQLADIAGVTSVTIYKRAYQLARMMAERNEKKS